MQSLARGAEEDHPSSSAPARQYRDLVPPGLVPVPRWRPDAGAGADPAQVYSYCAIGRVR